MLAITMVVLGVPAQIWAGQERSVSAGRLRISVETPAGYSFTTERLDGGTKVTMENPVWPINIDAVIIPEREAEFDTAQWQRNLIISRYAQFLAESKEQDYKFQALNPIIGSGQYCVFTDQNARTPAELPPGGFMNATTGVKVLPGGVVIFVILSNDVSSPEYDEAFSLFVSSFFEG